MKKLYQALLCRHRTAGGGHRRRGIRQYGFPDRPFRFAARTGYYKAVLYPLPNYDPFYYHGTVSQPEKTEDIAGENHPDLDYQCKPTELVMVDILPKQDILLGSINQNASINGQETDVYFYHGDHLGSANWITDFTGTPI